MMAGAFKNRINRIGKVLWSAGPGPPRQTGANPLRGEPP